MAVSKIGDENLYIGGLMSLSNKSAIKNANITHVVTVLHINVNEDRFKDFDEHLHIPVNDVDDEDLLQYFPRANEFIQAGLDSGGGVLIHCAMGKSRSAAVCLAFLLHRQPTVMNPQEALDFIRDSRPLCEPNDGFMQQLELYHEMGCPDNVVDQPLYQRWLYQRTVEESIACGKGPNADEIRFEDQDTKKNDNDSNDGSTEIRCRKCRQQLATAPFISAHTRGTPNPRARNQPIMQISRSNNNASPSSLSTTCAHIFLHPMTWMRPSLFPTPSDDETFPLSPSKSKAGADADAEPEPEHEHPTDSPLSGRITCPNTTCGANIGKFAWPGIRCNCGIWVVPAIAVARARVDVIDSGVKKGVASAGAGIRLPPGMVRTGAAGNAGHGAQTGNGSSAGGRGVL